MFALFFILRPLLVSSFGILSVDLLSFAVGDDSILTYAICGLIFTIVFHVMVLRLYCRSCLFSDRFFRICDFDKIHRFRFAMVLLAFVMLTYAVNAFKFHSLTYFVRNLDSFAAGVSLEGGLWFVQILSSIAIFPAIVFLASNLKASPIRLIFTLVLVMVMFNVLAKPSTRTETITLLLAVAIYSFSLGKFRINLLTAGVTLAGVILLLVFLDKLRQGNLQGGDEQTSALSILIGAFQNVGPADNGMILIDYLKHHSWLYFRYLLPSLSPLSLVPSAIFPLKPRTDVEGVLTYAIFGFNLDPATYHEGGTLTYTVPVAGYADYGYVGVVVAGIVYGFIFSVFLRGWRSQFVTVRFLTLYYIILLIGGLRLSIEALMQSFYWTILATWVMHFVGHVRPFAEWVPSHRSHIPADRRKI